MFDIFPFENIREPQKDLMDSVYKSIKSRKHILINAPTGIGKTVASLVPAIQYLLEYNKDKSDEEKVKIFFLTSRHTQHQIVLETVRAINEKNDFKIKAVDIFGKKWMCLQDNVSSLSSREFTEFCKSLRESSKCEFYSKTKNKADLSTEAKLILTQLSHSEANFRNIKNYSEQYRLCPYEIALSFAKKSDIIIGDYQYIFNPGIRMSFLNKINASLDKSIIIIDEAHNLPSRLRDIMSRRLTTNMIKRAIIQAKKNKEKDVIPYLATIQDALNTLSFKIKGEKLVKKEEFIQLIAQDEDSYIKVIDLLDAASERIRNHEKISYLSSIAEFLDFWLQGDEGFIRYIKALDNNTILYFNCLDPSFIMKELTNEVLNFTLMSGTLNPVEMYQDLLGFDETNSITKTYQDPFPKKNRLNIIIPRTTSLYKERSEAQFKKIAKLCSEISASIKGNIAIFFPSYQFLNSVSRYLNINKVVIKEKQELNKEEKAKIISDFKRYSKTGAILLAVAGASFSEGIDLPGDLLKAVIIVGLPLEKPSLETKALIEYYQLRFNKGWLYGYIYPAMIKVIQAAGRCIRTEKDKGAIIFLDERYSWPMYYKCFPEDWHIKILPEEYITEIKLFFENSEKLNLKE